MQTGSHRRPGLSRAPVSLRHVSVSPVPPYTDPGQPWSLSSSYCLCGSGVYRGTEKRLNEE